MLVPLILGMVGASLVLGIGSASALTPDKYKQKSFWKSRVLPTIASTSFALFLLSAVFFWPSDNLSPPFVGVLNGESWAMFEVVGTLFVTTALGLGLFLNRKWDAWEE